MTAFSEVKQFMLAGDQTVDVLNAPQAAMYANLIEEEVGELFEALTTEPDGDDEGRMCALIDGAIDSIVVLTGFLYSIGVDPHAAWDEVHRSNMTKVDPVSGKLAKREDGKILKPAGYSPPDLRPLARDALATLSVADGATVPIATDGPDEPVLREPY